VLYIFLDEYAVKEWKESNESENFGFRFSVEEDLLHLVEYVQQGRNFLDFEIN